jgi:hypothetical protein
MSYIPPNLLGCEPVEYACGAGPFAALEAERIVRDRDRWTERQGRGLLKAHVFQIARQQFNNCSTVASKNAVQIVRHQRDGSTLELSDTFCYSLVNGGRDAGSTIGGNLEALRDVGTVPATAYPNTSWRRQHTDQLRELARQYQIREWLDLPDFDAAATAILFFSKPVVFGVRWGYAGHAIVGVDVVNRASLDRASLRHWAALVAWLDQAGHAEQAEQCGAAAGDDRWVEILNSWGKKYGDQGFGYLPESQVASGIRARYGGWAPLTATHDAT